MIIERCRELALRAPATVVFPDALDQRVLKAAQYLHQQGLATPILVANPFELRQFALSHGVAMDGLQVIDPHGNLAMREEFAHRWLARAGEKRRRMRWKNSPNRLCSPQQWSAPVKRMSVSRAISLPRRMCCVPDYALSACSQAVKRSHPFS